MEVENSYLHALHGRGYGRLTFQCRNETNASGLLHKDAGRGVVFAIAALAKVAGNPR